MPKIEILREIEIAKDPTATLDYLANLQNWPVWSPWLILQPDCVLEYFGKPAELGSSYRWVGHLIGAGQMWLVERSPDRLQFTLAFEKPFRSKAHASIQVRPTAAGCTVVWEMISSLPWFMFVLRSRVALSVRLDYERGLKMLKSQLETDSVHSQVAWLGRGELPQQHYLGIRGQALTQEIGAVVEADLSRVQQALFDLGLSASGHPLLIYEKVDYSSGQHQFVSAIPIASPVVVDAPLLCARLGPAQVVTVRHTGCYDFVGNAWALAMLRARLAGVKLAKAPIGVERYLNDPSEVAAQDLITEVSVFCR